MYEDYVSVHARVLEGVRSARVRAITEMRVPPGQHAETCVFDTEPAVSLWVHADSGETSAVCSKHLAFALKTYRTEDETYPPALVPLKRTGR